MTGGAGFTSNMTTSLKNNRRLRSRKHSFRNHEMNLPDAKTKNKKPNKQNATHSTPAKKKHNIYNTKTIIVLLLVIISMIFIFILS